MTFLESRHNDLAFEAFQLGAKDARSDSEDTIEKLKVGETTSFYMSFSSRLNRQKLLPWQDKHYDEGYAWMWERELPLLESYGYNGDTRENSQYRNSKS